MLVTESSARDQNIASEGGRGDCNFMQPFILQDSSSHLGKMNLVALWVILKVE